MTQSLPRGKSVTANWRRGSIANATLTYCRQTVHVLWGSTHGGKEHGKAGSEPMDLWENKSYSVGSKWVYIFNHQKSKKEIPAGFSFYGGMVKRQSRTSISKNSQVPRARAANRVTTASGTLRGNTVAGTGVRAFLGIPFGEPPVGKLRWRPPKPVKPWSGARKAVAFGPRSMQLPIFANMVFRDKGPSEDCLYLNVWTPAKSATEKLPVMFWIFGGGFQAGAPSEPRQEGVRLAQKDVVVVSCGYRLGIFGFFAHTALTKETPHQASGNYGLMDQVAALEWVKKNIAAFGGDPNNVTIFGESAGSFSVSALMASPLV